ncbi:MAG: hypothetical protein AM326_07090 [Candidatus Thorarchaeota archaeon SMTZ-45]|nr:MAG: hypothetical protein AM325_02660 [Candidatus Thorarchaeota archaeon SMTZ1-45]KXH76376.1 MAG: hypothetical protein AM326_07090 [Candidatus Thorarchaeota archaeon SMTZ-45]
MKDAESLIEKSKLKDAQEIINVINSSNRDAFGRIIPKQYFREPIITLKEYEESLENMTFYIHRYEGSIIAVAALSVEAAETGRIRWVYVLPNHQKQGIGTALVSHIEAVARDMGLKKIRLVTDCNATWAIRFYKNRGYTQTSSIPNPWGFNIWMEKEI